jgi:hypothetical protein
VDVELDVVDTPDLITFQGLVAQQVSKMNAQASPGFDCVAAPFIKHAVVERPRLGRRGYDRVNVLQPYIAQLFKLLYEKARIPADWKKAKMVPLYKKGVFLDPNNYRMLAVSGTFYRMYANVLRSLITDWCMSRGKIPDTQFGFCPGRNTLQPLFILRHLQHAAQVKHPHSSPRLHAAFIDFKQAYDTIPRQALWQHLQRICMPAPFLAAVQDMYEGDEYVLKDADKTARVHPTVGVKQGCPLSPLFFSLYINDVDWIAEECTGAVTGTENFHVSHLLFADDLTLLSNSEDDMQRMLNRLHLYAKKKHLIINTSKSEVVHFNSQGPRLPTFRVGGAALQCKESFKYLGMVFHKTLNMEKSSEHVAGAVMAASGRISQFVRDYELDSSLRAALWLGKTYLVPAAMYGSQVWGTGFLQQDSVFKSDLQVRHLGFLKRILGVKSSTSNWAVLRECGHEPLQFNWFRGVVKMYNSMLGSNSNTLRKVIQADHQIHPRAPNCWTAQVLDGFQGLSKCDEYVRAFQIGDPIRLQEFANDLRLRLRKVWNTDSHALHLPMPRDSVAIYKAFFGVPFPSSVRAPMGTPHHMYLNLSRHVLRNVNRFRLRAHTLRADCAIWSREQISPICDRCSLHEDQDEVHVLFKCSCPEACQIRRRYIELFQWIDYFSQAEACLQQVSIPMVSDFLSQQNNKLPHCLSEIMDLFMAGVDQPQTDWPNYLAEGPQDIVTL